MDEASELCLKQYNKAHDRAIDWLIASWDKTGAEKEVCLEKYKKFCHISNRLAKKLNNLWKNHLSNRMKS